MLDRDGVPLLRHDRAHLHVRVGDVEVPDLEPGPGVEILGEPPEMDEEELERAVHAGDVVVGGDAAVGVVLHAGEAEELGHRAAVQREARGRDRRRAHAGEIRVAARQAQALHVAEQELDRGRRGSARRSSAGPAGRGCTPRPACRGCASATSSRAAIAPRSSSSSTARRSLSAILNTVWSMSFRLRPVWSFPAVSTPSRRSSSRLDEEEEVLVLAGVGERRDVGAPLDVVERLEDRPRLRPGEEALRGQHDRARPVDPHLLPPVVLLHALEERREHRLPVHRRRKPLLPRRPAHAPLPLQSLKRCARLPARSRPRGAAEDRAAQGRRPEPPAGVLPYAEDGLGPRTPGCDGHRPRPPSP